MADTPDARVEAAARDLSAHWGPWETLDDLQQEMFLERAAGALRAADASSPRAGSPPVDAGAAEALIIAATEARAVHDAGALADEIERINRSDYVVLSKSEVPLVVAALRAQPAPRLPARARRGCEMHSWLDVLGNAPSPPRMQ